MLKIKTIVRFEAPYFIEKELRQLPKNLQPFRLIETSKNRVEFLLVILHYIILIAKH